MDDMNNMPVNEPEIPEVPVDSVNWAKEIFEWVLCIVIAIAIAMLIKNYVFALVRVDGESMVPTLSNNDRLFTRVIGYNQPKNGDIIIFHPSISETKREPRKDIAYVKRVIATEGQVVDITDDGDVIVDGKVLEEDYIKEKIQNMYIASTEFPFEVPEDTVFVLGDNRNNSHDSRSSDVGAVPLDNIMGKAEFRLWPLGKFGLYK